MRKESSTVQKCKRQMATLGFDSQLAYHRVKLILKIYRDVVWVLSERVEELHEYAWELGAQDADTAKRTSAGAIFTMLTLARWSALNRAEYVLWSFSRTMWATGTVPQ